MISIRVMNIANDDSAGVLVIHKSHSRLLPEKKNLFETFFLFNFVSAHISRLMDRPGPFLRMVPRGKGKGGATSGAIISKANARYAKVANHSTSHRPPRSKRLKGPCINYFTQNGRVRAVLVDIIQGFRFLTGHPLFPGRKLYYCDECCKLEFKFPTLSVPPFDVKLNGRYKIPN